MHHSAATTICKIEEGEQGEVLGWTWVIGWEAGRGKVVATGREEKVMAGQRDPWMKSSEREFEEESEEAGRWPGTGRCQAALLSERLTKLDSTVVVRAVRVPSSAGAGDERKGVRGTGTSEVHMFPP